MSTVAKAVPQRTCVGCREAAAKSDLVRLVAVAGKVLPVSRAQADGRGAYLHPKVECGQRALARKALNRAFRAEVDTSEVVIWLEQLESKSGSSS